MRTRTPFLTLMLTALLLGSSAPAMAAEAPSPADPGNFAPGHDWSSRLDRTHLIADARRYYVTVDATDVTTPYIDLEIVGLMPWRTYELALGHVRLAVHTDIRGHGIAWNVFTDTATWVLSDRTSGEPVSLVGIVAPPPTLAAAECWWWCPSSYSPPQPAYSDPLEVGFAVVNGAYSYDPTITITISDCWKNGVTVDAHASGGVAANGGAGAAYSFEHEDCAAFSSQGEPRELRRGVRFKRDHYDDGSWKVYAVGATETFTFMRPESDWEPPAEGGYTLFAEPGPHPIVFERRMVKDLAIWISAGVKTYGIHLGVKLQTLVGSDATIRISFMPVEPSTYKFIFVDERQGPGTGMHPAAWRID